MRVEREGCRLDEDGMRRLEEVRGVWSEGREGWSVDVGRAKFPGCFNLQCCQDF